MDRQSDTKALEDVLQKYEIEVSMNRSNVEIKINPEQLIEVATALKSNLSFELLMDVIAVDYLTYGDVDWKTNNATSTGYSRAVKPTIIPEIDETFKGRFAVFYQLLSVSNNQRLTLKVFTSESNPPSVPSLVDIWSSADWFEREAFDLMGIHFDGHPDLRRILTDYGFIGHPFRKDFPTNGNLEAVYDEEKEEVVYQPVSISTRPGVPRVIRDRND
ncbi:MAG: NADH-quinone oxidoreductase subunit C [Gammaproteobacteria bacterium]|nr:NADH-quinone oxidoreductase subunit C [Gammaproteobacteria bacterium]MBI73922.1 NADH-quinone oxidoreductase subunit C [Gammaproteobacteria bacterium]HAH67430.1 NADH-quinone oxidoreductase subunit C [Gammaproteobacteria bacterium]|tara:strand:+ start:205 stop:855 length:651 start_codon:yes stop_codon:yes gene_type:complete